MMGNGALGSGHGGNRSVFILIILAFSLERDSTNNIYVGATCEPTLARALSTHVGNRRKYLSGDLNYRSVFKILDNNSTLSNISTHREKVRSLSCTKISLCFLLEPKNLLFAELLASLRGCCLVNMVNRILA